MVYQIGVVGGGVVGLTTALHVQKNYPDAKITIIADNFSEGTTSNGAAGIFRPSPSLNFGDETTTKCIIRNSYDYYRNIYENNNPSVTGVNEVSGYIFSNISSKIVRNIFLEEILEKYRILPKEEMNKRFPNFQHGCYFTTLISECHTLLPWYLQKFQASDGLLRKEIIEKLSDLAKFKFDVIFNCAGLGAQSLCNDKKLIPIRGQILQVPKDEMPWQSEFMYGDYDAYIIPGKKYVILGGCRNYDSYDLNVNKYDTMAILDRCTKVEPRIEQVKEFKTWVGLRPHRDPVRIESQCIEINNSIPIIHNYGHGGYGVLSAPGSAMHANKIFNDLHRRSGLTKCKI